MTPFGTNCGGACRSLPDQLANPQVDLTRRSTVVGLPRLLSLLQEDDEILGPQPGQARKGGRGVLAGLRVVGRGRLSIERVLVIDVLRQGGSRTMECRERGLTVPAPVMNLGLYRVEPGIVRGYRLGSVEPCLSVFELLLPERRNCQVCEWERVFRYELGQLQKCRLRSNGCFVFELGDTLVLQLDGSLGWFVGTGRGGKSEAECESDGSMRVG